MVILLSIFAVLGNVFSYPLFFSIDLIFGSIATMYAALTLGRTHVLTVALIGSLYTYYLWGHPYAAIIFTLEALWVVWFLQRGSLQIILVDLGYWLFMGIPLVFICYTQFIGVDTEAAGLIALKQTLNGIFNVLIANFIFLGIHNFLKKQSDISIQPLLFNIILLITLIAGTIPSVMSSYQTSVIYEQQTEKELNEFSQQIKNSLIKNVSERKNKKYPLNINSFKLTHDMSYAILNSNEVIFQKGSVKSLDKKNGEIISRDYRTNIWLPNSSLPAMKRWQLGRYLVRLNITDIPNVDTILVEKNASEIVEKINHLKTKLFLILAVLMFIAILLAYLISRWITHPLNKLDKASQELVFNITKGKNISLPTSLIKEYNNLSNTLLSMASQISSKYLTLTTEKQNLVSIVDENTVELKRLSMVASRTTNGVIITDVNGNTEWVNDAFTQLTGYSINSLIGKKPGWILQGTDTNRETVERISSKLKNKEGFSEELINYTHDGLPYWVHIDCDPLESDGEMLGFIAIESDITQRKIAEETLIKQTAELNALFNAATEISVITTDIEGLITTFNPGAEKMLGYKSNEMVGKLTPAVFHIPSEVEQRGLELSELLKTDINGFSVFVTIPVNEGSETREWTYVKKDGSQITVLLSVTVIQSPEGKIEGYLGIALDISERKRLENMKNEFVSTVSHELRTPLTSINGTLGLISGGAVGEVPNEVKKMLEIATSNSNRLTVLINDLLDMEKIASGNMQFDMSQQPLMPIIEQSIIMNKAYADKYDVEFKIVEHCDDAIVKIDSSRLLQVMANFLSNAAKFSHPGGHVDIVVTANDGKVKVSIQDYGTGIEKNFYNQIFSKFSQADSSDTRSQGGTGLGLSITKELIIKMRGNLGFESEKGKGSIFWFELSLV